MTALCAGGASQSKAGFAPTVVMTGAGLAALLNNVPTPWAVLFGALLAGATYDLSTLCTTDPPALPTMTATDMLNIAVPLSDPVGAAASVAKFYTFIKYWAWFQYCECAAMATPAPAAAPAPPVGLPQLNPPSGTALNASKGCFSGAYSGLLLQDTPPDTDREPMIELAPPGAPATIVAGGITYFTVALPSPVPLSMHLDMAITFQASATQPAGGTVYYFNAANALIQSNGFVRFPAGGLAQTISWDDPVPATATHVCFGLSETSQPAPSSCSATTTWYCSGSPAGGLAAPCPPDPATAALLQQILQLVTLIQRQAVPFAYVATSSHVGIAGTGSFAIQGLIGMQIAVTAYPGTNRVLAGEPNYIYDLGWVSIETPDGFIDEKRITNTAQLWSPRLMSEATKFGYSLRAGVTATFTELTREP